MSGLPPSLRITPTGARCPIWPAAPGAVLGDIERGFDIVQQRRDRGGVRRLVLAGVAAHQAQDFRREQPAGRPAWPRTVERPRNVD